MATHRSIFDELSPFARPPHLLARTDVLTCQRERMRALLLLCVFAHASVWGNPERPQGTIPKGERTELKKKEVKYNA